LICEKNREGGGVLFSARKKKEGEIDEGERESNML